MALVGERVGPSLRRLNFRFRCIPRLESAVLKIERGEIVVPSEQRVGVPLSSDQKELVASAYAWKNSAGDLSVTFIWGGGFPSSRTFCLFYSASDRCEVEDGRSRRRLV